MQKSGFPKMHHYVGFWQITPHMFKHPYNNLSLFIILWLEQVINWFDHLWKCICCFETNQKDQPNRILLYFNKFKQH